MVDDFCYGVLIVVRTLYCLRLLGPDPVTQLTAVFIQSQHALADSLWLLLASEVSLKPTQISGYKAMLALIFP